MDYYCPIKLNEWNTPGPAPVPPMRGNPFMGAAGRSLSIAIPKAAGPLRYTAARIGRAGQSQVTVIS